MFLLPLLNNILYYVEFDKPDTIHNTYFYSKNKYDLHKASKKWGVSLNAFFIYKFFYSPETNI